MTQTKPNVVASASKARYQIQTRAGLEWDIHSATSKLTTARQWALETRATGYATRIVDRRTGEIVPFGVDLPPPGDVRSFRAFEDYSGVSALVDVSVDGQRFTYSCTFLGTESALRLIAPLSGTRRASKIAADMARRAFDHALASATTPEYREATRVFYATPEIAS